MSFITLKKAFTYAGNGVVSVTQPDKNMGNPKENRI